MKLINGSGGLTRGHGICESVQLLWIYSIHKYAETHDAITSLTDLAHITSEQHIEFISTLCKIVL